MRPAHVHLCDNLRQISGGQLPSVEAGDDGQRRRRRGGGAEDGLDGATNRSKNVGQDWMTEDKSLGGAPLLCRWYRPSSA